MGCLEDLGDAGSGCWGSGTSWKSSCFSRLGALALGFVRRCSDIGEGLPQQDLMVPTGMISASRPLFYTP